MLQSGRHEKTLKTSIHKKQNNKMFLGIDNKYKKLVREVQDELSSQYIHENLSIKQVVDRINSAPGSSIANGTVSRFFHFGKGGGKLGYVRGPYATTLFSIADAIDFEVVIQPRSSSSRKK